METVTNGANGAQEEPGVLGGLTIIGSRELFVREHAAQILAALIVRRSATSPEQLIEVAVSTAAGLYDHIKSLSLR